MMSVTLHLHGHSCSKTVRTVNNYTKLNNTVYYKVTKYNEKDVKDTNGSVINISVYSIKNGTELQKDSVSEVAALM